MQPRSLFSADIVHLCIALKGSPNGRRPTWKPFSQYGVRNFCRNLRRSRHPQLYNVSDRKQVTTDVHDRRKFCHDSSQHSIASEAAFEGVRDGGAQDQIFCPRPQSNSKPHASCCQKPAFRTTRARRVFPQSKFSKEQKALYTVRRGVKFPYPTPTSCLTQWLDAKSEEERWFIWNELAWRGKRWEPSLPTILLQYLQHQDFTGPETAVLRDVLDHSAVEVLKRVDFSTDDVHLWAYIVTASMGEEAARRYLSSSQVKPIFILLEVLRRPRLTTTSFRSLLIHSWDRCLGLKAENLVPPFKSEVHHAAELDLESLTPNLTPELQPLSFSMLISRLLIQGRRVWAPAVISISHMFIVYWKGISGNRVSSDSDVSLRLHARICEAYNCFMRKLAVPASMAPMKSMRHNWDAQRLLLESTGRFSPALVLNQASYRAVARVLLALKKSEPEMKYAGLLHRSWPPWRKDQDGMDVERPPEDDISRAVAANYQMKEAGYQEKPIDKAIRILGGRESDGTPTIPTRFVVAFNPKTKQEMPGFTGNANEPRYAIDDSAARIVATRDAREAWAVFLSLTASQGRPTYHMYHAMLEKLIYHAKAGSQTRDFETLPGCGKEPIPLPDDNISESERLRTQPPDFWKLYAEMIQEGIRLSGRFLEILIVHAVDFDEVRIYLEDSGMSEREVGILTRGLPRTGHGDLERIPPRIVISFVRFLSNIARSCKLTPTQQNPMFLAFDLVSRCRFQSPVALYALIIGLSHPGLHFFSSQSMCRDRMTAWGLVSAALNDFQKLDGDLDPRGLQLVCRALELALPAFDILYKTVPAPKRSGLQVVKKMFASLSMSVKPAFALPRLLHDFEGAHLHAYVRVLCLSRDMDEIASLLQWMVQHRQALEATAEQARNGGNLLRRTLIAVRALLESDDRNEHALMHRIRNLVDELEGWGGWPTPDEVNEYLESGRSRWSGMGQGKSTGREHTRDVADKPGVVQNHYVNGC